MASRGYRRGPRQSHSLCPACRQIWSCAPQHGQGDVRRGNAIFKGWSHRLAQKGQKDWDCLVGRGEGRVGYNWDLQSHCKLNGELLFTKSCNVRAEGHSVKIVGDEFKRDESCTALDCKVWTYETCCPRTLKFWCSQKAQKRHRQTVFSSTSRH